MDSQPHRLKEPPVEPHRVGPVVRANMVGVNRARAFSLMELLVVLSVAVVLTGLLMPAMSQLRETAHRMVSASNMRQLDLGVLMYANDWKDGLPYSYYLDENALKQNGETDFCQPQELMIAHLGSEVGAWDGIGLLYQLYYVSAPAAFYCPSYRGEHTYESYELKWQDHIYGPSRIYTNYHYCGHIDWETEEPRNLEDGERLVILTDGLRTKQDFNHVTGMNVARADGSVRWLDDAHNIYNLLPSDPGELESPADLNQYRGIWRKIQGNNY